MDILNALKQLRDDIKTWVTNNLNALNAKIDEKTIPIDSELSSTSTNPVQNKVIKKAIDNIPRFSGDYNDLTNAPDISEDDSGNMIIADESGNIIFKADADGIHTTAVSLNGEAAASEKYVDEAIANIDIPEADFTGYATEDFVTSAVESAKEELSESITAETEDWKVVDSNGNIIFSVDNTGAHTTSLTLNGEEAATKTYVDEAIGDIEFPETDFTGYATEDYVDNAIAAIPQTDLTGYATEKYVDDAVAAIDIPETDLSDYYTKEQTDTAINTAKEEISESIVAESEEWKVVDEAGNIIFSVDATGAHTTALTLNGESVEDIVDEKVASLVDSAPDTLNTLNELASALGDDPNFATTITTEIGKKVDKVDGKGLSTNDFTNEYKDKLDNLENVTFEELDPTVPAWAKAESKPIYTADEIGAVSITEQNLTDDQKAQARTNIGAVSMEEVEEKLDEVDLDSYATEEYVNDAIENVKGNIGDFKVIIDVVELPIENVREDCFYRLLSGSLVYSQRVFNTCAVHCVETLPETGLPAINIDQTEGNVYYSVSDDEAYGYVDDILSVGLGVPAGWYSGATLLGALGYEYAGVITNILDDPSDGKFRLLLEYVIYDHKSGNWASHKKIGRAGTGASAEVFNHPTNVASGVASHAEGIQTTASGNQSHAEGYCSHAEGESSHAEGESSHAEGYCSHAEGESSHAEGNSSHAEGSYSHAEGFSSHAEGFSSHAEGFSSHAEGNSSHAAGRSQHVQGEFNLVDPQYDPSTPHNRAKYAHIVGNGAAENSRSNAHTLDWEGNAWYQGDVYVGSNSGTNMDEGSKKLATEEYVNNIAPTHSWNGTTLTITSASGTSSANLKGEKGDKGDSVKGDTGPAGVGVSSVKQTTTSTADAGSNVMTVTLSNGATSTFTVKNGSKGSSGADGKTPIKGIDYWTPADQEAIVQQVIAALGTPVFGRVDGENNIILTGELADGTYTVKYEDGEGNVTEIGTAKIGSSYINQITISTDTDGSVYNGKGWIENKRIGSSGAVSDVGSYGYTGVTGFIPIADGDIIRTSANIVDPNGSTQQSIGFYDADKNLIARHQYRNATNKFDYDLFVINNDKSITFKHDNAYLDLDKPAAYVRFCFVGITDGAIITTNEEITEQGSSSGMGDSGSIELVWSDGVKLDKTTGAEGTGDGYAASQHIELVDGYTYTFDQHMDSNGFVYGGINICYYDANGTGLGYELLWDSVAQAQSKALSPISGAKTFRVRLYYGQVLRPGSYSVIYAINA